MASPPPRSDVTLYFDTLSASTLRVMTALHEKQVDFDKKPLDPSKGENLQTWFLQISPTGSLPVLRHKVGEQGDLFGIEDFGRSERMLVVHN